MSCTRKEKSMRYRDKCKAMGEGVEVKSRGDVRAGAEQEVSAVEVDYHWDFFDFGGPGHSTRSAELPQCLRARWRACRLALGF